MQKRISLLVLTALLFLTACGNQNDSSLNSSDSTSQSSVISSIIDTSDDSSSSSISTPAILTKTLLAEKLNAIRSADSYNVYNTQNYSTGAKTYIDTYSKNYIYRESSLTPDGYLLTNSVQDVSKKVAYRYSMKDEHVVLENEVYSESQENLTSLDSLNPMKNIKTVTSDDFVQDEGYLYLSDAGYEILYALGYALNYSLETEDDSFSQVRFSLDKEENLVFTLLTIKENEFVDYDSGTFKDINKANNDKMNAYLATDHTFEPISDAQFEDIISEHDFVANIDEVIYAGDEEDNYHNPIATTSIHAGNTLYSIDLPEAMEDMEKNTIYEKKTDSDNAFMIYLDGRNTIAHKDTNQKWSSLTYMLKDNLSKADLVKIDDDTYRYFGANGKGIYKSTSYLSSDYGSRSIDFCFDHDKLSNIILRFDNYFGTFGTLSYHEANVSVSSYTTPSMPTKMSEDTNTAHIKAIFDNFDGSKSFSVTIRDEDASEESYREIKYTADTILEIQHGTMADSTSETGILPFTKYSGYVKKEDKWVKFIINKDGLVRSAGVALENTSLKDLIGFDAAAELFKISNPQTREIRLKTAIYDIGDHIIVGDHKDHIVDNMLTMTYAKTNPNLLETIRYRYSFNHDRLRGYQVVEFSDYEVTTIPDEIKEKLDNFTDYSTPTSWIVEDSAYKGLVSLFGEEVAKKLPYLYSETLFGLWVSAEINHTSENMNRKVFVYVYDENNVLNWSLSEDPIHYMDDFETMLKADVEHVSIQKDGDGKNLYYICEDSKDITTAYAAIKRHANGPQEGFEFSLPQ